MQHLSSGQRMENNSSGEVVCFGVLSYLQLMVVDQVPVHNQGTPISQLTDSYGDDAAIVAGMLHQWGQKTRLIPSAVGDDDLGRKVAETVGALGVPVSVIVDPDVATVAEISIADPTGARTYFYQRTPRSEEHTSELQSRRNLVCRLLLAKKKHPHPPPPHTPPPPHLFYT